MKIKNQNIFQRFTLFIPLGVIFFLTACSSPKNNLHHIVKEYYATYQSRSDFDKFLDFYDDNMILEDIINGDKINGKAALKIFFDWKNPSYKKLNEHTLIISEQIIEKNKAVTSGYFTAFEWGGQKFEEMHFTTILIFNEKGKIIKHTDWINYPNSLINYNERKNSNEWIKGF